MHICLICIIGTALLSIDSAEVINLRSQISKIADGVELFFIQTIIESYVKHRNSDCFLYITATIWNQVFLTNASSKMLFVHFKTTSLFLPSKRSCFLLPLLAKSIVISIRKESYWRRITRIIRYPWYCVLRENAIFKTQRNNRLKVINIKWGTIRLSGKVC